MPNVSLSACFGALFVADLIVGGIGGTLLGNTLSAAGNSTTKKRGGQPYWGGENAGNALEASNALEFWIWGIPAVVSTGNSRKRSESVSLFACFGALFSETGIRGVKTYRTPEGGWNSPQKLPLVGLLTPKLAILYRISVKRCPFPPIPGPLSGARGNSKFPSPPFFRRFDPPYPGLQYLSQI